MTQGSPAVLLDRDGTIIVDSGYLSDPDDIVFEPDAIAGLLALGSSGFSLVVVTNQSGIARGFYDRAAADAVNERIAEQLTDAGIRIAGWYVCPHGPDEGCDCRKPLPGMAHAAARDLNLDLSRSWVIGDKRSDIELAHAVGATGLLVTTGDGLSHVAWADDHDIPVTHSLLDAAHLILSRTGRVIATASV